MRNGTKIFHQKYGPGEIIKPSILATAVIVQFDNLKHFAKGMAKVVKIKDLIKQD